VVKSEQLRYRNRDEVGVTPDASPVGWHRRVL